MFNTFVNQVATYYTFIKITTDAGITWKIIWRDDLNSENFTNPRKITELAMLSENTIVAGVEGGLIIHTSNQGETWDTTDFNINKECSALSFNDNKHGTAHFLGGDFLAISDDFGNTWMKYPKPQIEDFDIRYNIDCINRINDSIFKMSYYRFEDTTLWIITSRDKGMNWSYNKISSNYIRRIHFLNDKIGWMGGNVIMNGDTSIIKKTTDGGLTWELKYQIPSQENFHWIEIIDEDKVYATNGYDLVKTINGGKTWTNHTREIGTIPNKIIGIEFGSKTTGLTISRLNYIHSNSIITNVEDKDFVNSFIIYPNPSNLSNSFSISSNFPNHVYIQIELINNLGIKVLDIFTGFKEAGEHIIQFTPDASLPSGVYWVRMIMNGTEKVVKPVIFISTGG